MFQMKGMQRVRKEKKTSPLFKRLVSQQGNGERKFPQEVEEKADVGTNSKVKDDLQSKAEGAGMFSVVGRAKLKFIYNFIRDKITLPSRSFKQITSPF